MKTSASAPSFFGRWTSRIAVFSAVLLFTAAFLHRIFSLPTPIAFNLAAVAFLGAALAIIFAVLAIIGIWRTGRAGTSRAVFAILISLALMLWPLFFLPKYDGLPSINDVTTDTADPPPFVEVAKLRPPDANAVAYPGEPFARKQAAAYPDIRPIEIDRPADEVFELVMAALRRLKLPVVHQQPPDDAAGRPGFIEVADRTFILGIPEDIAIRVTGTEQHARVDVRSAWRYGRHDLGFNADRVRVLLKEIVVAMESTVPAARNEKAEEPKEEEPRNRRSRNRR